ncbi:MAG: 30S ribosomal protein S12 methylthiotransferase RimO [Mogibacterium sp.]|nr:30S ribosomal protein S12 methylthiotransferase RimO [Mogibacterium sp.]
MKKIYIDTLGCAKNEYDSQMLAASLLERGCCIVYDPLEADILIVNTCGFIEDAKKESIERIFELADQKGRDMKLVVTGCLSERYHNELAEEMPEVDMFFGVNDYDNLPGILMDESNDPGVRDQVGTKLDDLAYHAREFDEGAYYGYLKIAEGCNNACSFCAIPSIRGPFRSKRIEDCVREAEDMADAGIRELILIAQDTSQYGRDLYGKIMLPELLHQLCRIEGIDWIRLMYVYDNGITDELIDTIANEPKICKYIDMPIQHIADPVLHRMRRQSTGSSIKAAIEKLRARIPDVHIRTTLLVGFPGETEQDIDCLLDFIDTMKLDRVGAFAFSDEEGTPSFELDGKLDEETKQARRNLVMEHQLKVSEALNELKIGRTYEVIVDEIVDEGVFSGRTRYDSPEIDCEVTFSSGNDLVPGDIVNVRITNAYEYDLEGEEVK